MTLEPCHPWQVASRPARRKMLDRTLLVGEEEDRVHTGERVGSRGGLASLACARLSDTGKPPEPSGKHRPRCGNGGCLQQLATRQLAGGFIWCAHGCSSVRQRSR